MNRSVSSCNFFNLKNRDARYCQWSKSAGFPNVPVNLGASVSLIVSAVTTKGTGAGVCWVAVGPGGGDGGGGGR